MSVNDGGCDWYCDNCDATLNIQPGFTIAGGSWTCTMCGCKNDVTANNILTPEEAEFEESIRDECPKCGGHLMNVYGTYECESCGTQCTKDHGLLWFDD